MKPRLEMRVVHEEDVLGGGHVQCCDSLNPTTVSINKLSLVEKGLVERTSRVAESRVGESRVVASTAAERSS